MTIHVSLGPHSQHIGQLACGHCEVNMSERSFPKCSRDPHKTLKDALWAAFPEETSDHAVSETAAEKIRQKGGKISGRGIRRWFARETFPQGRTLQSLGLILPAEVIMDLMFGKDTR